MWVDHKGPDHLMGGLVQAACSSVSSACSTNSSSRNTTEILNSSTQQVQVTRSCVSGGTCSTNSSGCTTQLLSSSARQAVNVQEVPLRNLKRELQKDMRDAERRGGEGSPTASKATYETPSCA